MRAAIPLSLLATALACSLATTPANARARVFVASYGNDANPCTFGSPCKTFQQAVNVVDAGGEVTAIDSAGFGPISISKSVTITSPDGVEAGIVPVSGGNAITIGAGATAAVELHGLTVDGSGVGMNGVVFNSGGSLTVNNSVVRNFTGNGILVQPSSGTVNFTVTNTTVSNSGTVGIQYSPASGGPNANVILDHVVANANVEGGINIDTINMTACGETNVTIANTIVDVNESAGIRLFGEARGQCDPVTASIDNVNVSYNTVGVLTGLTPNVLLGRSVITGNATGINCTSSATTFFSYSNNQINYNTFDITGTVNTVATR